MKTLLLATDLSTTADHAVKYGYHLAQNIHANIVLCHAFMVPAEVPQAGVVVWPMDTYQELSHDNEEKLNKLKMRLEQEYNEGVFTPNVKFLNEMGPVADIIRNAANSEKVDMIVIGTHHTGLNILLAGDHDKLLIDRSNKPLLIVPPNAKIHTPQKIAFASDLRHPDQDIELILLLIPLIRTLGAELYITHIQSSGQRTDRHVWLDQFLIDIAKRTAYAQLYSKVIDDDDPIAALRDLSASGDIDLLVMVHRRYGLFENLFRGSYTKKAAKTTKIPLLVIHSTH